MHNRLRQEPPMAEDSPAAAFARATVLVVGIESPLAELLRTRIRASGCHPRFVSTGEQAVDFARTHAPRLAIVRHELADMDARELCGFLRRQHQHLRIVVVASGVPSAEVARWLDLGVDDVVSGSDVMPELMARARRLLRRRDESAVPALRASVRFGSLVLDVDDHLASVDDTPVPLSPLEFNVLHCLVRHSGRSVSIAELLHEAWGERAHASEVPRKVLVAVSKVRRALAAVTDEIAVERVRGDSYRLC